MRIIRLTLRNIRSYESLEVDFPTGIILLTGDIGSGKSTLLLAIEFALFGIVRGHFTGETLLRKGAEHGSVSLRFSLAGAMYTITRTLKRGKSIQQGTTQFESDAGVETLSPVESKMRILQALGYPTTLLHNSKSLLYRYTVYTPQEDMKRILEEQGDVRMDILRNVFTLAKYKRISENSGMVLSSFKQTMNVQQAQLERKEAVGEQLKTLAQQLQEQQQKEKLLQEETQQLEQQRTQLETEKKTQETQQQQMQAQQAQLQLAEQALLQQQQHEKRLTQEQEHVQQTLTSLQSVATYVLNERLPEQLKAIEEQVKTLQEQQQIIVQEKAGYVAKQEAATSLQESLRELATCPVCHQEVGIEHKQHIHEREQKKILLLQEALQHLPKDIDQQLEQARQALLTCKEQAKAEELKQFQKKNYDEARQKQQQLVTEKQQVEQALQQAQTDVTRCKEALTSFTALATTLKVVQEKEHALRTAEQQHQQALGTVQGVIQTTQTQQQALLKEQQQLVSIEKTFQATQHLFNWTQQHFLPLVQLIEKHVLFTLQQEFSSLFKHWFSSFIEDDQLQVAIDDQFTPHIEHQGHDLAFSDLSGGERTSVALAYRLSLTKVINELVSDVRTKDFLILDEPTEGFSSGQLAKLRDVLMSLSLQQVILVSHDSPVEAFADCVFQVTKDNGVSKIEKSI